MTSLLPPPAPKGTPTPRRARTLTDDERARLAEFGIEVRSAREAKGLSQSEAAALADMDGGDWSKVERGVANLTLSRTQRVAAALGMRIVLSRQATPRR